MAQKNMPGNEGKNALAADHLHRELASAVISFHEAVARRLDMTAAERKCIGILSQLGTCTAGRLAEATGLSTGAITGIADRLERAGWLLRSPNPKDRRSVLLTVQRLDELNALQIPIFASLSAEVARVAAHYSEAELSAIHRYLAEVTGVLHSELKRLQQD